MSSTDELLANNATYVASFDRGDLALPPAKKVAVLACMDARLDPAKVLGLAEGDAHVIRNAGGVATDDAIRSIVISQRLLGTEEIVLIHHTECGMETFSDDAVKAQILADTGIRPAFALEAFPGGRSRRPPDGGSHPGQPLCAEQVHPRLRLRRSHRKAQRGGPGFLVLRRGLGVQEVELSGGLVLGVFELGHVTAATGPRGDCGNGAGQYGERERLVQTGAEGG